VVSELPKTRETLLLRLLGAGKVARGRGHADERLELGFRAGRDLGRVLDD